MRPGLSPWMVLLSSLQRGRVSSQGRLSKGPSGSMVSQRRLPVATCVQPCARCMQDFDRARAPGGVPLTRQLPDGRGPDPSPCPANPRELTTHIALPISLQPPCCCQKLDTLVPHG